MQPQISLKSFSRVGITVFVICILGGFAITRIDLATEGTVPGIDSATFDKFAKDAKENCPVSKALKAVEITLTTKLG